MATIVHDVHASQLIAQIELRVRFRRLTGARLWLGGRLMRFAAWVAGCPVEIEVADHRPASMAGKGAVPIRYDARDPAFDQAVGNRLRVSLDGVEMGYVVAYDMAAGTVLRHATDARGSVYLNPERTEIVTETLTGDVAVDWIDAEAA